MASGLDLRTASKTKGVHLSPMSSDTEYSPVKDGEDTSQNNTPRKNKRKSSEPRKRSDFSIKRLCPDAPYSGDTFHAEDGEGRYGENPPSTPETSTPSPPDNVALRIPQVPPRMPTGYAPVASPAPGFLPHYPLSVPLIPVPPTLMAQHHHMVARQQPVTQLPISTDSVIPQPAGNSRGESDMDMNHHVKDGKGKSRRQSTQAHRASNNNNTPVTANANNAIMFEAPAPLDRDMDIPSPTNRRSRKNYKNMTRERRVEANARERSRVHTISAAFENLRRAVPSYSYNQRLSKLAILRIACTYIMSLASLAGEDYSWDKNPPSFQECVDQCTKTIQTEGRAKRRH